MKIEHRLKQLANSNSNYSLLWAQWEFDKKLLHRALNTISRDFPHYSLHDSSHSSTIITQIEKIISPDIDKLSATDCWLLLEACYWHDAGMIISKEEKQILVSSIAFSDFLNELVTNNSELSSFAEKVLREIKGNDVTGLLAASDALTFVLSDYYRKIHAERSGVLVQDPQSAKIASPRTSLIPKRLFGLVALIIACHGKNREEIINLARRNEGMDSDDYAHPRYIASLLRIGDLLDIDDGRFCQTLLSNIGDVPISSLNHQRKHASIESLHIDSDSIEIEAICHDYASYSVQRSWFDYIKNEFDYQKSVWNSIAPNNTYRALPTISKLNCVLSGYLNIDGAAPKINLDTQRIYDYLTGTLIYSEKYPYIRELIQNAIDATMYKVWDIMTHTKNISNKSDHIVRCEYEKLLNNERIDINIVEIENEKDEEINYTLTIKDSATGISFEDLKKIFNCGSENTPTRKKIKNTMPDWAKPSGFFGLGLHSAFRICEKVKITTRVNGKCCYVVDVLSTGKIPEITIKEIENDYFIGTEIKTEIHQMTIPDSVPYSAIEAFNKFDPLTNERLEVTRLVIYDIITETFLKSPVKLYLNNMEINSAVQEKIFESKSEWDTDYTLGADFNLFIDLDLFYQSKLYYKNSFIDIDKRFIGFGVLPGLSGTLNIYTGDAINWVTIDRKKLRSDKFPELRELVTKITIKNREKIISNTSDISSADLFYYSYYDLTNNDKWRDFKISELSLGDYLDTSEELFIFSGDIIHIPKEEITLKFGLITECISKIVIKLDCSLEILPIESKSNVSSHHSGEYYISKFKIKNDSNKTQKIDISQIKHWMKNKDTSYRLAVPCFDEKYDSISLKRNDFPKWMFSCSNEWHFNKYLALPFKTSKSLISDINVIYNYYIKNKLTTLDENTFSDMYLCMWEEIGIVNLPDEII
ncbi:HD domain-containing protein [Rahnella aceris]